MVATCSSTPRLPTQPATCNLPQNIGLVLRGSERLNPNDDGRSLPVVVRIYQLKSGARMEEAEFEGVWRHDREVLGEDILKMDEMYLYPNQRMARTFRRDPAATHVVAVAIFRHPAGQAWRTIYELPPPPGDERCAAQSADPTASPPPVRDARYVFYLEDYYIEPGTDEPPGDAGIRDSRGRLRLPSTLPGRPSVPSVSSPPTLPSVPNLPGAPTLPGAPAAPTAPSLPSAPTAPSLPSAPTVTPPSISMTSPVAVREVRA
jgi:type VI secretion system protein VasD